MKFGTIAQLVRAGNSKILNKDSILEISNDVL
jgi:hypothetical protein